MRRPSAILLEEHVHSARTRGVYMQRIIKANWVRRLPTRSSYMRTLEADRDHWKHDRIDHVKSLVGSTERLPDVVCRIEKYGAFVNFDWGQGLVHVSEMSKDRIGHANEVVSLGQKVHVYVIAVDDRDRISLSLIGPVQKEKIGHLRPCVHGGSGSDERGSSRYIHQRAPLGRSARRQTTTSRFRRIGGLLEIKARAVIG